MNPSNGSTAQAALARSSDGQGVEHLFDVFARAALRGSERVLRARLVASSERYRWLAELGLSAFERKPLDELIDRTVVLVAENLDVGFVELLELRPDREALSEGVLPAHGYINVNLSPRQVTDPGLVDTVVDVLRKSGSTQRTSALRSPRMCWSRMPKRRSRYSPSSKRWGCNSCSTTSGPAKPRCLRSGGSPLT